MTMVSIADACRLLGIDPKTLHHWLAQAHFDLQPHPADARKHGLRLDDVRHLAHLHQRSLVALPSAEPAPSVSAVWPAPLLALPATLDDVQAQIAALQQQVAELRHLLQPHAQPLTIPVAPAPQTRSAPQTSPLASPACVTPRTASAAKATLRKRVNVIPRVEWNGAGHYVVLCPQHGLLSIEPDTAPWFAWLAEQSAFRFVGKAGHFSAHHAWRVPHGAWRAHRRIRNHMHSLRLAPTQELTSAVLEQVAAALEAQLN